MAAEQPFGQHAINARIGPLGSENGNGKLHKPMFPWVPFPPCHTARQNCFVCYAADKDETDETKRGFGAMGEKWVLAKVPSSKSFLPKRRPHTTDAT